MTRDQLTAAIGAGVIERVLRDNFAFPAHRTILETNGRRWHADPLDYEGEWSVPGRHGYKLVLATWDNVVRRPGELQRTLAA